MVSKIIFRLALIAGIAALAFAGTNLLVAPPVPVPANTDGWVDVDYHDAVREQGRTLDAFDTIIVIEDFETDNGGWVSGDLTIAGVPYWQSAAVPIGDATAPALWCGDASLVDNLVAPGGYSNHQEHYLESPTLDLSGSSAPIRLAFKARWKVEGVGGETPPYNMWDGWSVQISTDGGSTWTSPDPADVSLPYTGTCSFAWSDHCYSGCYPAWGGVANAGAYLPMSINLDDLAGQSNVRFRYAFLSDPAASADDGNLDSSYYGLIVDSVRFTNSTTTLLSNDGDNITGWTIEAYPVTPVGDTWVYEDSTAPTGMTAIPDQVWAWNGEHRGLALLENTLTSPLIVLPDTALPGSPDLAAYQKLRFAYYVYCDMQDWNGDPPPDTGLDDLYEVYISADTGQTWTRLCYDYGYDNAEDHPDAGNSLLGWVRRGEGLTTGAATTDLAITGYGARAVMFQFRVSTDCNNDGGIGSGLHIDFIHIQATRAYADDASAQNLVVPFPTTVGLRRPWRFDYVNEGSNTINATPGNLFYRKTIIRPNGTNQINLPAFQGAYSLATNEFVTLTDTTWVPDVVGSYRLRINTALVGEDGASNDTIRTPINVPLNGLFNTAVDVQPAGTYELAYHLRDYTSVLSNPRLVRYSPAADGVPAASADTMDINKVQILWNWAPDEIGSLGDQSGRCRLNFYGQGPDNRTPGALLYTYEQEIDTNETVSPYGGDSLLNRWWEIDLSAVAAIKRISGDFWVEVMALDSVDGAGYPGLLALVTGNQDTTDTHNYTRRLDLAGAPILASPSRFCVEVTTVPTVWPDPVTNLTILRSGVTDDVILRWSATNRADAYNVYRSNNPAVPLQTLLTPVPILGTTYTDTGALVAGDKFFYVVTAVNQ
jgi:hypothetical protein